MAVKFISFEESQQQIKPKEFVSFEESQQEIAEPTNKFVPFEEYKATIETEVQTFVPYEEASTFKPFIPFDDAMGLPSQEEVMKAHAELRKPLQDITPSRGGLLTKEIVEKWGAIQQENPEAVNWKYIPVDVSYKEYNNVVSGLLFDKLQRGEFGVANAMDKVMTGDDNAIKGAIDGLTGKEKRDFYDIAIGLGFGKWQSLAIGMVAGVVLDPVNYIPFGTAFKFMSKTIGKTKAMDAIRSSNIANFLRKGFTSGEGAPPALHELTKTLKKYKRYEEGNIYEEVENLSKLMKNKKNAELITQVRAGKLAIEDLTPEAAATLKKIDDGYAKIGAQGVKAGILKQEDLIENYQHGFYFTGDTALTKINSNIKNGHAGAPAFAHMRNYGAKGILMHGDALFCLDPFLEINHTVLSTLDARARYLALLSLYGYTAEALMFIDVLKGVKLMPPDEAEAFRKIIKNAVRRKLKVRLGRVMLFIEKWIQLPVSVRSGLFLSEHYQGDGELGNPD